MSNRALKKRDGETQIRARQNYYELETERHGIKNDMEMKAGCQTKMK